MNIIETGIEGLFVVEPRIFADQRGYFFESFSEKEFRKATGVDIEFVQDNESKSSKGVLRGLHFQTGEYAQAKLVRVVSGAVQDVAVDLRKGSPTFGKYFSIILTGENKKQFFIPAGFAHGFVTLDDNTIFQYKCSQYYAPGYEGSVRWNDPDISIKWSLPESELLLSEKDRIAPFLAELL
ncbi:MAG: dTDP-4-dehydrorhamnose 3,5-epimerase [Bacteroidales bacterium]|nr:dTDP-4-dehydrorhamnose 3,5-epimerase [Bacteroidales bacterium]